MDIRIEQSQLKQRLLDCKEDFVLFDVGLGAAANALAALACVKSLTSRAQAFHLISFERDLDLLQFALDHAAHFSHFHGYENAIRRILAKGEWHEGNIHWYLRTGDFL